jgi:type IV secretion system protein VirB10
MVGVAFTIMVIILLTGHADPPKPARSGPSQTQPALAPTDRIRNYFQHLNTTDAHQRETDPSGQPQPAAPRPAGRVGTVPANAQEEARRESQSLFADNVALSRRPTGQQPYAERSPARPPTSGDVPPSTSALDQVNQLNQIQQALTRAIAQGPPVATRRDLPVAPLAAPPVASLTSPPASPTAPPVASLTSPLASSTAPPIASLTASPFAPTQPRSSPVEPLPSGRGTTAPTTRAPENPAPGARLSITEGTVIETVLLNRLDGTFAGPVSCLVTSPVYSRDRQAILIPAGARVLGAAAPVQAWGDSRLAVSFHRLLMPDGHSYNLDLFKGLDQIGETGLRDDINHHYLQIFGASLAIGALSGLAQYNTRSGISVGSFGDEYRQAAGASLANSSTRVLDRYLNVLPTITIREGYRIKVYLTNDLALPVYAASATGGVR